MQRTGRQCRQCRGAQGDGESEVAAATLESELLGMQLTDFVSRGSMGEESQGDLQVPHILGHGSKCCVRTGSNQVAK